MSFMDGPKQPQSCLLIVCLSSLASRLVVSVVFSKTVLTINRCWSLLFVGRKCVAF